MMGEKKNWLIVGLLSAAIISVGAAVLVTASNARVEKATGGYGNRASEIKR